MNRSFGARGRSGSTAPAASGSCGKTRPSSTSARDIDHGMTRTSRRPRRGIRNASQFLNRMRGLMNEHKKRASRSWFVPVHQGRLGRGVHFESTSRATRALQPTATGDRRVGEEPDRHVLVAGRVARVSATHGLEHNFMGSVEQPNFPTYKDAAGATTTRSIRNSVMEYNGAPDRRCSGTPTGRRTTGSDRWIYANNAPTNARRAGRSPADSTRRSRGRPERLRRRGQGAGVLALRRAPPRVHAAVPPGRHGHDASEILANQIENYDGSTTGATSRRTASSWNNAYYADAPATLTLEMRRFISLWSTTGRRAS